MAKYTMEIRDIVESQNVDLFDFDYEYYADNYALQKRFENMFINHYYFHEIGFETVERFKWNLRAKLNLNAPKYKQYWDSYIKSKNIDFTVNKEYYETVTRDIITENESSSTNKSNSISRNESDNTSDGLTKTSALADGVSKARIEGDYITGVQQDVNRTKTEDVHKAEESGDSNTKGAGKQNETLTTSGKGNIGTTSSAQLIKEWREIMLNLDRQLIEDCTDLFMQIY